MRDKKRFQASKILRVLLIRLSEGQQVVEIKNSPETRLQLNFAKVTCGRKNENVFFYVESSASTHRHPEFHRNSFPSQEFTASPV